MTPTFVAYLLAALGLFVGVGVVARLVRLAGDRWRRFAVLFVIPVFAGAMYVLMAFEVGLVTVAGVEVPAPRYVDWLVTTPVLVGYVAYVAGAGRRAVAAVAGADAAMIAVGWVGVVTTPPVRWVAFAVSSAFYLGLLYALYGPLTRAAKRRHGGRLRLFQLLRNHVGLLWVAYPVVWLAGPLGVGAISTLAVSLTIAYLDVVAKTPYVYFVYAHRDSLLGGADRAADAGDASAPATPTAEPAD